MQINSVWFDFQTFVWMMNPAEEKRKDQRRGSGEQLSRIHLIFQWILLLLIFQMQNRVQNITHVYFSPSAE